MALSGRSASALECADVLRRGVDEKIDVLGGPHEAMQYDGEAADQDVADGFTIQRSTEGEEVFDFRRAGLAAIWVVIHRSASSWLVKR